jgi:hypothetical protein
MLFIMELRRYTSASGNLENKEVFGKKQNHKATNLFKNRVYVPAPLNCITSYSTSKSHISICKQLFTKYKTIEHIRERERVRKK